MAMNLDAVMVGARCAGAATAMLLARAGARVMLVDKGAYGADTLSTHALMRGAVLQLHRWGLLPEIIAAGTPPIRSTTFSYPEHDVTVPIEPRHGVAALYAPRRALLDRILMDAAARSGVDVRYGVHVDDVIVERDGRVGGVSVIERGGRRSIRAAMVIGADGLYSTIARRVRARRIVEGAHTTAVFYSYWSGLPSEEYRWWFRPGASIGTIPTNNGATCVFASLSAADFRTQVRSHGVQLYTRLIRHIAPSFAERLTAASRVEPIRGFGGHPGFMKQGSGPGWALVGDAGYFKDPLTAHGITDAFRDAELLARAMISGAPGAFAEYEAVRDDLSRTLFDITDEIASLAWTDDRLQWLHRAFSAEMSREVRALASLEMPVQTSPVSSAKYALIAS
jgi:flavin-dependent dehydrogenase